MRWSWQNVVLAGVLAAAWLVTQSDVAVAQLLRSKTARPSRPPQEPGPPVLDRVEILVNPAATGDAGKLQQEIALQFARQPLCPRERMDVYAWLGPGRAGSSFSDWWGAIEKTTKTASGWLVNVVVDPRLSNGGCAVYRTEDRYLEVYEYSAGTLRFLRAEVSPNGRKPRVITFN